MYAVFLGFVDPEEDLVGDGGVAEGGEGGGGFGGGENAGGVFGGLDQDALGVVGDGVVESDGGADGGGDGGGVVVDDFFFGDGAVGDEDVVVGVGDEGDGTPGHFDDAAFDVADLDPVAGLEGDGGLEDHAGEEVAEGFLKGEAEDDGDDGGSCDE